MLVNMNEFTPDDRRIALDVVNRFEREWRDGRRSRIADLLVNVPDQARGFLLAHLLRVELELRREQGDTPTVDDYANELCEWSDLIRNVFDGWSSVKPISTEDARLASTAVAPTTDPAPPDVEGFKVLGVLGRGGMGVVYKGWQDGLGRFVAIKTITGEASSDRFRREARLIAQINSPHVVAVHDLRALPDGRLLLVMEYVEGASLAERIKAAGGPLPEREVVPWMQHVAEGMIAASQRQIIHRDLKPSNILIDTGNRLLGGRLRPGAHSGRRRIAHRDGRRPRDALLHGSRAGRGSAQRRQPGRHLQLRRDLLSRPHRDATICGKDHFLDPLQAQDGTSPVALGAKP